MNRSTDLTKLAESLNLLQAKMPPVIMNVTNKFFDSQYADLGAVIETSKPLMAEFGFSISQTPTSKVEDGIPYVGVTTLLLHISGQFIEDTIFVPIAEAEQQTDKKKQANYPQKAGIGISYLRRYAWASALGMYADEDVDGNIAQSEVDVELVKKLRKDLKTIYDGNPELQEKYRDVMTSLGYKNELTDVKLIEKVIKQFKGILGE